MKNTKRAFRPEDRPERIAEVKRFQAIDKLIVKQKRFYNLPEAERTKIQKAEEAKEAEERASLLSAFRAKKLKSKRLIKEARALIKAEKKNAEVVEGAPETASTAV